MQAWIAGCSQTQEDCLAISPSCANASSGSERHKISAPIENLKAHESTQSHKTPQASRLLSNCSKKKMMILVPFYRLDRVDFYSRLLATFKNPSESHNSHLATAKTPKSIRRYSSCSHVPDPGGGESDQGSLWIHNPESWSPYLQIIFWT